MNLSTAMKKPSAWIPVAMSLAALGVVLGALAIAGGPDAAREPDEGTAAHLFQLLMVAQVPVVAFFAVKWLPRAPKQALLVLTLQAVAGLAALAPVFFLHL